MPLAPAPDMLAAARAGGYALGYFESWDSYSLEAVLAAVEAENAPVIVGFGATMLADEWLDTRGIDFLGASGRALLEGCKVPVSFLLNETHTLEQAVRGVGAGVNVVMVRSPRWRYRRHATPGSSWWTPPARPALPSRRNSAACPTTTTAQSMTAMPP
jgi:fructose/tagatose bisphosphate aldolase